MTTCRFETWDTGLSFQTRRLSFSIHNIYKLQFRIYFVFLCPRGPLILPSRRYDICQKIYTIWVFEAVILHYPVNHNIRLSCKLLHNICNDLLNYCTLFMMRNSLFFFTKTENFYTSMLPLLLKNFNSVKRCDKKMNEKSAELSAQRCMMLWYYCAVKKFVCRI